MGLKIKDYKKYLDLFLYFFVVVSVIFLVRHLLKNDLLYLPANVNYAYLALSLAFLFLAFFFNCLGCRCVLRNNAIHLSLGECAHAIGISILGKYIPGKIWLITGMSGKVSQLSGAQLGKVAYITTLTQIITIVIGAMVGLVSLARFTGTALMVLVYAVIAALVALFFIFKRRLIEQLGKSGSSFTHKWVLPLVVSVSANLVLITACIWVFWSVGFFFLSLSIIPGVYNPIIGFSFAFAASLGILVIIAPGGLGVREGLLGLILSGYYPSVKDVATLSAFSRLWFLVGELVMFLVAVIMSINSWTRNRGSKARDVSLEQSAGPLDG